MLDILLCLDVETVPDETALAPKWPAERFPPPHAHRVVAISFVEATIVREAGRETYLPTAVRSGGELDYDEERLLRGFWGRFGKTLPRVATWNGRGFDLPVLRTRCLRYGVPAAPWFTAGDRWEGYGQRYKPDWHCDLMECLSDFGAAPRMALEDVCRLIGLPGKAAFGHGSEVAGMVAAGELAAVRDYCETDCLNLFLAYLRWAVLTGRTDAAGHNRSADALAALLAAERGARPHLGRFLDLWQAAPLPHAVHVPAPRPAPALDDPPHLESGAVLA